MLFRSSKKRNVLVVTVGKAENVRRASGNAEGVLSLPSTLLNAYEVIKHRYVVLMEKSLIRPDYYYRQPKSFIKVFKKK